MSNILCWTDIPVEDLGRATGFYSSVLGSKIEVQAMGGMEMAVLPHSGDQPSGCLVVFEDRKPGKEGPLIYLSVEGRLDDAAAAIEPAGGKVIKPRHQIGPYGYRVLFSDTEGNSLALHSFAA